MPGPKAHLTRFPTTRGRDSGSGTITTDGCCSSVRPEWQRRSAQRIASPNLRIRVAAGKVPNFLRRKRQRGGRVGGLQTETMITRHKVNRLALHCQLGQLAKTGSGFLEGEIVLTGDEL